MVQEEEQEVRVKQAACEQQHDHHDHHKEHRKHKEHGKHKEDGDTHSEITANYRFSCDDGAKLSSVSLALFGQFPGIEKMNAMWVTTSQQGAQVMTAGNNVIQLK